MRTSGLSRDRQRDFEGFYDLLGLFVVAWIISAVGDVLFRWFVFGAHGFGDRTWFYAVGCAIAMSAFGALAAWRSYAPAGTFIAFLSLGVALGALVVSGGAGVTPEWVFWLSFASVMLGTTAILFLPADELPTVRQWSWMTFQNRWDHEREVAASILDEERRDTDDALDGIRRQRINEARLFAARAPEMFWLDTPRGVAWFVSSLLPVLTGVGGLLKLLIPGQQGGTPCWKIALDPSTLMLVSIVLLILSAALRVLEARRRLCRTWALAILKG